MRTGSGNRTRSAASARARSPPRAMRSAVRPRGKRARPAGRRSRRLRRPLWTAASAAATSLRLLPGSAAKAIVLLPLRRGAIVGTPLLLLRAKASGAGVESAGILRLLLRARESATATTADSADPTATE